MAKPPKAAGAAKRPRAAAAVEGDRTAKTPPQSLSMPMERRARRSSHNEAISAIPANVVSIFAHAASTGDVSRQKEFYKHTLALDSYLRRVVSTRIEALVGRPVMFKPPPGLEGDREALEIARRCAALWNSTRRTADAISLLLNAGIEGDAGLAQKWIVDRRTGWHRPEFLIEQSQSPLFVWHPDTLEPWFNADRGSVAGLDKPTERAFPISSRADSFIHHSPLGGVVDYPWARGALRARVIPSILKRATIASWTAALDRWGQPQVYALVDYDALRENAIRDADGDEDAAVARIEDEIMAALRSLGRDWRASFPKGVELESIDVSVAENLHSNFVEWAGSGDAIAILGQNLSTEVKDGGSYAAAAAHQRVRYDILASDAFALAETLTDQWCEPVVRYNWPGAPVPYVEFVLQPKRELTAQDFTSGLATRGRVLESMGHEPGDRADEYYDGRSQRAGDQPASEPSKPSDTGQPGPSQPSQG